ncbi:MAG: hypothetical protein AAF492_26940, partial [Verrucomicrobiota bacterium]
MATNAAGVTWGALQRFTVLGPPVVDNAPGATDITVGGVRLNGSYLTENRGDITIYWGAADGGTNVAGWANAIDLGPRPDPAFSADVVGLLYGLPYYYRVYGTNTYGTNWAPSSTNVKSARPPGLFVANQSATNISATHAVINGLFSGTGSVFELLAYWGTNDGGTVAASWDHVQSLGSFFNAQTTPLSVLVTGLVSNATHYFTFRMTNCAEDTWAVSSVTFNSKGPPRVSNNPGPEDVGNGVSRLSGTLINGGEAEVRIYWGNSDGGTNASAWDNVIEVGMWNQGQGAFPGMASGLIYGVRYFYRAYATNACGGAWAGATTNFKSRRPFVVATPGLRVSEFDYTLGVGVVNPMSNIQNAVPDGMSLQVNNINYGGPAGSFDALTDNNNIMLLWEGYFVPSAGAGLYTFALNHDDQT